MNGTAMPAHERPAPVDLVREHLAAENARDLDAVMATFTDRCWYAIPSQDLRLRGRASVRAHHERLLSAFGELQNEHLELYQAASRVFARISVRRRHTGAWGPFQPTGSEIVTEALAEFPIAADGLLEAEIVHTNPLHVLAALGVVPTANALELAAAYARRAQQSLLAGSVAVVTGGSRGIGAAIAQALAEAGAAVGLIGRSREALATAADDLRARGAGSVRFAAADAGDPERLEAALGRLAAELGPVTVLVNNAGMIERGAAEELTIEQWDRVIAVNLRAAFVAARTVFPGMREHGSGSIVNVTSLSGRFGIRRAAPYGASKGGLTQLTRALALEWAPHGIRVNAVAPGYVTTAFTERLATDRKRHRQILERIPLGRWGRPDDVGGTVVYLASGLSAYVTGQLVIVDGGYSVDG